MSTIARPACHLAVAALFLAAWGCAADGGPIGTGIAASVAGNVVAVVEDTASVAASPQDPAALTTPVTVSIDGVPGSETPTDGDGNFAIEGDFSGPVTLRFATATFAATREVEVPAGAVVTLSDVVVAPDGITADAGREIGVNARIESVDCAAGLLVVVDRRRGNPRELAFTLIDETRYVGRDGAPITCDRLRRGDQVRIDGQVELLDDGSRGARRALEVAVDGQRTPGLSVLENVVFVGVLSEVDCGRGILGVSDERQLTLVTIDDRATSIQDLDDGRRISCSDLELGQQVTGIGRMAIARPDRIAADTIGRRRVSDDPVDIRLSGEVTAKDCARSTLEIGHGPLTQVVRFEEAVVVPPRSCASIGVGLLVRGVARLDPARPGEPPEAIRLEFRQPARPPAGGGGERSGGAS